MCQIRKPDGGYPASRAGTGVDRKCSAAPVLPSFNPSEAAAASHTLLSLSQPSGPVLFYAITKCATFQNLKRFSNGHTTQGRLSACVRYSLLIPPDQESD